MSGDDARSVREIEEGVQRDFSAAMSYGDYLGLDQLLSAQHPRSQPAAARRAALHHPAPDLRAVAQADAARAALGPRPAHHRRARPGPQAAGAGQADPGDPHRPVVGAGHAHAQRVRRDPAVPRDQLGLPVLAVPRRRVPARQQERRHGQGLRPRRGGARRMLAELLVEPSLYDEFLRYLARRGYAVPAELLDRDFTQPYRENDALVDTFAVGVRRSRPSTGASTRPARSSSTSRTTSSSGGSGTCRWSPAPSATRRAPAARPASTSCAAPST